MVFRLFVWVRPFSGWVVFGCGLVLAGWWVVDLFRWWFYSFVGGLVCVSILGTGQRAWS